MKYFAVIDTNVLVSALLKKNTPPDKVVRQALGGDIIPLLNEEILNEYQEVLSRAKFKFSENEIETVITGIVNRGIFVDAVSLDEILPDVKDAVFYEVVMEGRKSKDASHQLPGRVSLLALFRRQLLISAQHRMLSCRIVAGRPIAPVIKDIKPKPPHMIQLAVHFSYLFGSSCLTISVICFFYRGCGKCRNCFIIQKNPGFHKKMVGCCEGRCGRGFYNI